MRAMLATLGACLLLSACAATTLRSSPGDAALPKLFDVRKVHTDVLSDSGLPLEVLAAKIDRWIAADGR